MSIYFDPSLLVALYLPELHTSRLRGWLAGLRNPIGLNVWQELEFRNAARQKVMRGEAAEADLVRTFRVFDDDCIYGRIVRRSVPWEAAFQEAERLSGKHAFLANCRAFDLIHVAVARVSGLRNFATLDHDQAKLAQMARLQVLNLHG